MCAGRKARGKGEREGGRQKRRKEGAKDGGRRGRERGGKERKEGRVCHLAGSDFSRSNTLKQATVNLLLGLGAVRIPHSY